MNEIVAQILDFIEKTGGILIKTGFEISVKYVIANAIGNLIQFGLSITMIIILLNIIKNNWKYATDNADWGDDGPSWTAFKIIISIVAIIIFVIVALVSNPITSIKMLISPEWYAIMNIIDTVKR